jgi:hypothetical protein
MDAGTPGKSYEKNAPEPYGTGANVLTRGNVKTARSRRKKHE